MYGNRALSQDWNGIITEPAANALRYSNVIYDKIKCGNFIKKVAAGLRFRDGHQIGLRIRDAHDIDFSKLFASDVYPAPNGGKVTEKFLEEIVIIIQNYIHTTFDRTTKIVNFHHPHQLMDGINGFNLDVDVEPQSLEQLLVDCQDTLKYGVKTGHPRYFNQLSSGLDIISLAAEWVTSAANTNMFTFEIAPVFVCMEAIVLRKMREIVGWTEKGDGIFSPGGSINNMYAVLMARNRAFPQVKKSGMRACPEMAMFVSKHAHYSNVRPAMALGLGMDNVILIEVDERGRMLPDDLEDKIQKSIKNGIQPFYVTATAGTTVVGAFDPIPEISVICKKYELWLHVDAAWGGGALMSKTYRHLIQGVELADSITWNPHKMMGITLQCSALLTKHEGLLSSCNKMGASYLFQQDKHYDVSYDTGDKTIQCGRHVDVFKLWLAWRGKGDQGFENHVDKCIGLARYMMERIKTLDGFELVFDEPQYSNVCFWYLPKWMRNMEEGADKREKLHKIAPTVKARMMECGSTMVGYQPLDEKVNFFRSVVSNGAVEKEDVDFLLSEIQRLGDDIKPVD